MNRPFQPLETCAAVDSDPWKLSAELEAAP